MKDFGLLILRLVSGALMAGHGAQKLFGAFGGQGFKGTAKMLEGVGLQPGEPWAAMAGASEFGGGVLTAAGFLSPVGTLGTMGAMGMATTKVHWGKPIWVTKGGAEYPITNIAIALALGVLGPGKYSLDSALNIHLPRRLVLVPGIMLAAAGVAAGVISSMRPEAKLKAAQQAQQQQKEQKQQQPEEQQEAVRVPERPETSQDGMAAVERVQGDLEQQIDSTDLQA